MFGLAPEEGRTLLFHHDGKRLAGILRIKGNERGPVVARLQPAASVRGRLLNERGRPLPRTEISVLFTLKEWPGFVFKHHGPEEVRTDAEGRSQINGLIPKMNYRADVRLGQHQRPVFADLTLTSGQAKDLGDVTPKKAGETE